MAKRKTGLSQQLAAVGGAAASTGTRARTATRSFGATGGQALPGTTLNQQASNPRYGQRFRDQTKRVGGVQHDVHVYANGRTVDMGATPGGTLQQAGATLHDALSALTQKSETKLVHALADHYANLTAAGQLAGGVGQQATPRRRI